MNIEMRGINKSFGSNQVLKDAGFVLQDGEVHALMGENGAGKSTLMKILTGVYTKDAGTVLVDGQEVNYKNPQEAEKAGIVFIYQELNVLFDLTVEENLFMGKEITKKFGVCDKKAMRAKAQEVMDRMGVHIPVDAVMSDLSVGQQQMVEICKALMVDAKVLIMDEPTAALTASETEVLFEVIKSLRAKGVSIVYISHRMEEIFELCDRITILRDGSYIGTRFIKDITMDDIVQMMIGREIGERYPKREVVIGQEVLRVEGLTHSKMFRDVNFSVRAGEVLGVSGLMGAGRTEIMQAIFGNLPTVSGKIFIDGKEVSIRNPRQAIAAGIALSLKTARPRVCCWKRASQRISSLPTWAKFPTSPSFPSRRALSWSSRVSRSSASSVSDRSTSAATCPAVTSRRWFWPSGSTPIPRS